MVPRGYCVHRTPTRLRIRVPERRGDSEFFARIREGLSAHEAVGEVEVNPATASVLVIHLGDFRAIADHAAARSLFRLDGSAGNNGRKTVASTARGIFNALDGRIRRLTGGDLNLPDTAFLVLVAGGLYQIARGNFAVPAWYTAFWYGLNIFLKAEGTRDAGEPNPMTEEGAESWLRKESGKKKRRPNPSRP